MTVKLKEVLYNTNKYYHRVNKEMQMSLHRIPEMKKYKNVAPA